MFPGKPSPFIPNVRCQRGQSVLGQKAGVPIVSRRMRSRLTRANENQSIRYDLTLAVLPIILLFVMGCAGSTINPPPTPTPPNPNAELNGMYAFAMSGTFGSFQADGNGRITEGVEDRNQTSSTLTGNYTIGSDGRGVINLNSSTGNQTLQVVMLSSKHGLLLQFAPSVNFSPPLLGTMDLQDPATFSLTALAANSYAFAFAGNIPNGANSSGVDAIGTFTFNTSGLITSGMEDLMQDVLPLQTLSLSGAMGTIDARGRGTATFTTSQNTLNFIFYVVDSTHLIFISSDARTLVMGHAFNRQGPFDTASVPAHLVLLSNQIGAVLTTDGSGLVTSGTADIVEGAFLGPPPTLTTVGVTGNYSMASNGRGVLSYADAAGTFPKSFVMYSSNAGLLLLDTKEQFGGDVFGSLTSSTNIGLPQQPGPFSNASFSGSYGEIESGTTLTTVEPFSFGNLTRLVADGSGNLTGIRDSQTQGGQADLDGAIKGTYSIGPLGRGTATLAGENITFYVINGSHVVFLTTGVSNTAFSRGFLLQQQ